MVLGRLTTPEEPYWTYEGDDIIKLEMQQVHGDYCYSAPTGLFNLACPEKKRKTQVHYITESYKQWRVKEQAKLPKKDEEEKEGAGEASAEPDFGIEADHWEKHKRNGPLLLRVKLDFKVKDKDVKIWYKIKSKSGNDDNINVWLPESYRKVHLSADHRRLSESLLIKDPSKGYFFKDIDDIDVDMKVIVQRDLSQYRQMNVGGVGRHASDPPNGKTVRIAQPHVVTYGGVDADLNVYDDDMHDPNAYDGLAGDDAAAYARFQD